MGIYLFRQHSGPFEDRDITRIPIRSQVADHGNPERRTLSVRCQQPGKPLELQAQIDGYQENNRDGQRRYDKSGDGGDQKATPAVSAKRPIGFRRLCRLIHGPTTLIRRVRRDSTYHRLTTTWGASIADL